MNATLTIQELEAIAVRFGVTWERLKTLEPLEY